MNNEVRNRKAYKQLTGHVLRVVPSAHIALHELGESRQIRAKAGT
jgi:hypothetical protein